MTAAMQSKFAASRSAVAGIVTERAPPAVNWVMGAARGVRELHYSLSFSPAGT
jgi:hypothetical protein